MAAPRCFGCGSALLSGSGLENKHSTAFFAAGMFVALLLTPERRHFAEKWIWFGGLIAFAIAMPNIIWQLQNHWPTYELLHNIAHSNKNVALRPAQFIFQQIVFMNPATLPLWLAELCWAVRLPRRPALSRIGIIYLVMLAEFIILHGKSYYLAPAYPMLLAAGGVAAERVFANRLTMVQTGIARLQCLRLAALLAPLAVIPILPPGKLVAYMKASHWLQLPRTETSHTAALPQIFADQFGWQEMVASVAHVYHALASEDREACWHILPKLRRGWSDRFLWTQVRTAARDFRPSELFSLGTAGLDWRSSSGP